MRQVLVDTNVLVSFLTDRDLQQQERSNGLASFGDACVAAAAQRCRCDAVATFDRRFAGWLRRNQRDPYW